ncbi:three-Cys-motif partner protein TcmP [Oscillochloris sp. ZM17-4]|uniref:three-Cys-motif partner protein TcmP n=1 Tax=Oscillochloris sp. ZM17-4 TaxID=2866714 RepID=UPI001C72A892|nr:three-Cys-motif partner protein TcmP [Oscillochloris sp. ZM17-4]MBX0326581.1 three-Cys-motif partner protein TcmP [Oscillochloris sp. ZM17-4]
MLTTIYPDPEGTPMTHQHFDYRREWSARKHAVLQHYLPAFCTALSRTSETIWYVDGFAGAGRYDDGATGSPLLAVEAIQGLPYDIRCLNVEKDPDCYAILERETTSYPRVTNIQGDFSQVIDQVLLTVQRCPAFFFLDPFGMRNLHMVQLIERIAMRRLPTDILLRYDTEGIRRVVGAYECTDDPRSVAHGQNLDQIFRGQVWRDIVATISRGPDRDDALLNHYLEQLVHIPSGRFRFAAAYPIRTIDERLKYHLVFATGDKLGFKIMSDVLLRAEASYRDDQETRRQQALAAQTAIQMGLFGDEKQEPDPEQLHQAHIAAVQASLHEVGQQKKRTWEFEELFYKLLRSHNWFARLSEKDYRAACKGLAASGSIERISDGRAWRKGTEFRIVG